MPTFSTHPTSWFADPGWIESLGMNTAPTHAPLVATRIKGVRAWITPPWAIESATEPEAWARFRQELDQSGVPLIVCDLPPGQRGSWNNTWIVQSRHTRWLRATGNTPTFPALPKHRAKQIRKGTERGLTLQPERDINLLLHLHQRARVRKSIASDAGKLKGLLSWVLDSMHQSTYVVRDEYGEAIASATFLHDQGRTVYAFGGQLRSPISSLATVMLIQQGISDAAAVGNEIFDFGGSADPGVDRFYAEFGAEMQFRERAVRIAPWAKRWLKFVRPDLLSND